MKDRRFIPQARFRRCFQRQTALLASIAFAHHAGQNLAEAASRRCPHRLTLGLPWSLQRQAANVPCGKLPVLVAGVFLHLENFRWHPELEAKRTYLPLRPTSSRRQTILCHRGYGVRPSTLPCSSVLILHPPRHRARSRINSAALSGPARSTGWTAATYATRSLRWQK